MAVDKIEEEVNEAAVIKNTESVLEENSSNKVCFADSWESASWKLVFNFHVKGCIDTTKKKVVIFNHVGRISFFNSVVLNFCTETSCICSWVEEVLDKQVKGCNI